jgi:hypothetical protein
MFPKKGKVFPNDAQTARHEMSYPSAIAASLRKELGDTHRAVKIVMKWTGANERTVKKWLAGTNGPRGEHLIHLFRHSEQVFDAFLSLAGREQLVVAKKLIAARDAIGEALEIIDKLVSRRLEP